MTLEGRTILVTGGSSGIGRATALLAADKGAAVINADLDREPRDNGQPVDELIMDRGGTATFIETDVTDYTAVRDAVDLAQEFGGLDALVNNAGRAQSYAVLQTTPENWSKALEVNLSGVYHGCRAAVEAMQSGGGGVIVNTASVFAVIGGPNSFSYSAAKGGVISLTRQLARDYATDDIRVNAVSPGFVNTPMLEEDTHNGTIPFAEKSTPMERTGEASEVAEAIVFLASERSSYITGQNLVVDGGFSVS